MYKSILSITLSSAILISLCNGSSQIDKDYGIYFCTRDLDHPLLGVSGSSSVGSAAASSAKVVGGNPVKEASYAIVSGISSRQYSDDTIIPCSNLPDKQNIGSCEIRAMEKLENDHNTKFRHCFVMLAEKNEKEEEINRRGSKEKYSYFIKKATYNFYGDPQLTEGANASEEDIKDRIVSCQKIQSFKEDYSQATKAWSDILTYFEGQKKLGYNPLNHNCCTVAYDSLLNNGMDVSGIDKLSFNLGIGIEYRIDTSNFISQISGSSSNNLSNSNSPDF